jgi:hypothetical protein
MKNKFLKMAFTCLLLCTYGVAKAGLISWDLTDPDSGFAATFVYDDDSIDGMTNNSDLVSITGDFGDGIFTYLFSDTGTGSPVLYDIFDNTLIRWTEGGVVFSTNASAGGQLSYEHYFFDQSDFILNGVQVISDWNGAAVSMDESTNLGVPSTITDVPEPSTLAIFALGLIGLASHRFKKQS